MFLRQNWLKKAPLQRVRFGSQNVKTCRFRSQWHFSPRSWTQSQSACSSERCCCQEPFERWSKSWLMSSGKRSEPNFLSAHSISLALDDKAPCRSHCQIQNLQQDWRACLRPHPCCFAPWRSSFQCSLRKLRWRLQCRNRSIHPGSNQKAVHTFAWGFATWDSRCFWCPCPVLFHWWPQAHVEVWAAPAAALSKHGRQATC